MSNEDEDDDDLHEHRCGWAPTVNPELHGKGCGHVFGHIRLTNVTDEVYDRGHLCPVCKMGPWKNIWHQGAEEHWDSLTAEEKDEIQEDVRREEAIRALLDRLYGSTG